MLVVLYIDLCHQIWQLILKLSLLNCSEQKSTQTAVFLLNRKGEFKRTTKIKLKEADYPLLERQSDKITS